MELQTSQSKLQQSAYTARTNESAITRLYKDVEKAIANKDKEPSPEPSKEENSYEECSSCQ
jgi:hypothetical protein